MARYRPQSKPDLCASCGHSVFRHQASTHMHWAGSVQVADGFCTVTGRGKGAMPCLCEKAAPICPCGEDDRDDGVRNVARREANRAWVIRVWSRK